ncbi:MAG: metallophosphoesterase family protein [Burkholderiales bacterium]|nr:metallophosphoesterase family protein [Burkholderiales bacterium]
MKIALLSDLHLSVLGMEPPPTQADVVVLAGDLQRPAQAMEWARRYAQPTLFVAGNHEFFGGDVMGTYAQLRAHAQGSSVRVLEQDEWRHDGVRFLGCTLWSDFRLFDTREQRDAALQKITTFARDYTRIAAAPDFDDRFTPALSQLLFDQSVAWLERRFAEPFDGPTVVITHFAPARGSIAAQFVGSPINAAFVSDLEAQIMRWQPALWLHGHVHDSFDYRIGATRVVANPRGYAKNGVNENKHFDPTLVLEV